MEEENNDKINQFLNELTDLSYKYGIIVIKTIDNMLVPVSMNQDDKGGQYRLDQSELIFM